MVFLLRLVFFFASFWWQMKHYVFFWGVGFNYQVPSRKNEKQQEPAKMTVSEVAHLTPRVWLGCQILGRVIGLDWVHLRYLFDIVGDIYNHKWGHSARNTQTYLGRAGFFTFGTSTTTHCMWIICRRTLPETNCSHLKKDRAPKGNNRIPTHPFSGANC